MEQLGLTVDKVQLGEAVVKENPTTEQMIQLDKRIRNVDLELITTHKDVLVSRIKSLIIEFIYHPELKSNISFSTYLSKALNINYNYLSKIFSMANGTTINHFVIEQKIERVKELLSYNNLNLSEISYLLEYSSVAHLSNQFKKITGMSVSVYKDNGCGLRRNLDLVGNMHKD